MSETTNIHPAWQHEALPCAGLYFIYKLGEWLLWEWDGQPCEMCWLGPAFGPVSSREPLTQREERDDA